MCYYTYSSLTYKDIIHKTLNNWIFLCFFIKKEYTILNKLLTNKKNTWLVFSYIKMPFTNKWEIHYLYHQLNPNYPAQAKHPQAEVSYSKALSVYYMQKNKSKQIKRVFRSRLT